MTVGQRLETLRKKHGLTQEQAGEIAGTSKQSTSQIESGVTKIPGGLVMVRWAKYYGVDPEWLYTGKGPEKPSHSAQPDFEILLDAVRALVASKREITAETLQTAYEVALAMERRRNEVQAIEPPPPVPTMEGSDGAIERRGAGAGEDSGRKSRAG